MGGILSTLRMSSKFGRRWVEYNWRYDHSQDGTSEAFIGEWAEKRGIRDRLFIATKVCMTSAI